MPRKLQVGDLVGAGRWPLGGANIPDRPWSGVLLAGDDPRAWEGTIAFGDRLPTEGEVRAHIARCRELGVDMDASVPVLWDFGPHGRRVYWEKRERIRTYAADVRAWRLERARALKERSLVMGVKIEVLAA